MHALPKATEQVAWAEVANNHALAGDNLEDEPQYEEVKTVPKKSSVVVVPMAPAPLAVPQRVVLDESTAQSVVLNKEAGTQLGIGVAGGRGTTRGDFGIFINKIIPGSVADKDGRLAKGDQILEVNNTSLREVTLPEAVSVLKSTPATVEFLVIKNAYEQVRQQQQSGPSSMRESRSMSNDFGSQDTALLDPPTPTSVVRPESVAELEETPAHALATLENALTPSDVMVGER